MDAQEPLSTMHGFSHAFSSLFFDVYLQSHQQIKQIPGAPFCTLSWGKMFLGK